MSLAVCPRCHSLLRPGEIEGRLACDSCAGSFIRGESPGTPNAQPGLPPLPTEESGLASAIPTISCAHCLSSMVESDAAFEFDCPSCGGRWIDGDDYRVVETAAAAQSTETPPPAESNEPPLSAFTKNVLYGLSLPERALRSGIGLTAGAVKEVAGVLIPQAFHSAKSYEIAIDKSLRFLTETIGGVSGPAAAADEAGAHVARKAVGNFVDLAGLATLHVSPMWVLAAVSDFAYGSKTYVREVADELQKQGIIDSTSTVHHMDDILDAIQRSSGSAASTFDTPPLSVEELKKTLTETREELRGADLTQLLPEAEVRRMWMEMQLVATQQDVSLLEVSSAMTMRMLDEAKTVSSGALTGIRVAGGLFRRSVLEHYTDSLARIREQGFYETVAESYRPYVEAVWYNFAEERETWTEQLLNPNKIAATVDRFFEFLEGDDEQPSRT